uniref:Uncharacterized protein n=1 Tax=Anguilla anguilla TaxID=7936 RepID=A0A0E9PMH3_ANGAN
MRTSVAPEQPCSPLIVMGRMDLSKTQTYFRTLPQGCHCQGSQSRLSCLELLTCTAPVHH